MATQARFGRLPRAAPNLTATIVALAEQYAAMRERNITDAWKNGGDFEGKDVTDERLMKFLKDKLKGLSPDDPVANETRNQISQYEFAIANSKQELKYARGQVSDSQMAAFYTSWANKLPRDSEAYRERARLAAGYADRASSAARGRRQAASDEAYYNKISRIHGQNILAYDTISGAVAGFARSGILGRIAPVLDTEKEGLQDLRVNERDAGNFLDQLNYLSTSDDPDLDRWKKEVVDFIRNNGGGNLNRNDIFTQTGLLALADAAIAGYNQQIATARRAGRKGDVNAMTKDRAAVQGFKVTVSTIDEKAIYEQARRDWLEIVEDPTTTIGESLAATSSYAAQLLDLAKRAKAAGDDVAAGRYNNEFLAANGGRDIDGNEVTAIGPTMWESSRPTEATHKGGKGEGGDAEQTAASVRDQTQKMLLLQQTDRNGNPMWVQVKVDEKGNPTSSKAGIISVVPVAALPGAVYVVDSGDATATVPIRDPITGAISNVRASGNITALVPKPIIARPVKVNPDGTTEAIDQKGNDTVLGQRFTLDDGTDLWAYEDNSGRTRYSLNDPFLNESQGGGRMHSTSDGDEYVVPYQGDAAARRASRGGIDRAAFIQPSYFDNDTSNDMPNTVFNSAMAAEMAVNPTTTYTKYTSDQVRKLAQLQAGGDPARFAEVYGEVDRQRADYVSGGSLNYDQIRRLAEARRQGKLPTVADATHVPGTKFATEQAAIGEIFQGMTAEEMTSFGAYGSERVRAREMADRYTPAELARMKTPLLPDQSRKLANQLVGKIWDDVYRGTGVPSPVPANLPLRARQPGAPGYGAARGRIGVPAPTPAAPPRPTAPPPKAKMPPPAPPAPPNRYDYHPPTPPPPPAPTAKQEKLKNL